MMKRYDLSRKRVGSRSTQRLAHSTTAMIFLCSSICSGTQRTLWTRLDRSAYPGGEEILLREAPPHSPAQLAPAHVSPLRLGTMLNRRVVIEAVFENRNAQIARGASPTVTSYWRRQR